MTGDTRQGAISVDGVVTAVAAARVAAMDHGFLFGDSVYEVVRTFGGRPVALQHHFDRLRASAAQIYFDLPWTDGEIRERIRACVAATELREQYVRVVATRGPGPMSLLPDGCGRPCLVIYVLPLRTPDAAALARGLRVHVPQRLRNDTRALPPSAKTGNYLNNLLALVEAQRAGAEDAVLVGPGGVVTEATTANVFWVTGGTLFTPSLDCGILAGITRSLLLPALRARGHRVEEGRYPLAALLAADEAFLTGTVRGVQPVVRVDDRPIGDGAPGPRTREFIGWYDELLSAAAPEAW